MDWNEKKIGLFFQRTLVVPMTNFLKQGISPRKLALTIALGIVLGIFPVFGFTTILCTIAAVAFRVNMPAIQLVNYFVSPLQVLLIIPHIRAGEILFGEPPIPLDVVQMMAMIQTDVVGAVNVLWWTLFHAVVAWTLIGFPLVVLLYFILIPILDRLVPQATIAGQ